MSAQPLAAVTSIKVKLGLLVASSVTVAALLAAVGDAAGVPLLELRPADGAGLEEMFLELTATTQREGVAA